MAKEQAMTTTIDEDEILLDDAEDFKLPSSGNHDGNLSNVELTRTKADDRDQFIVTVTLSPEDPDAPNLPMRKYYGWPHNEDRSVMWGSRTAYGAMVQALKELMTAFGGKESGGLNKQQILAFLDSKKGLAVKVKVKQELRKDPVTKQPIEPHEMQANVAGLLPA